MFPSLKLFSTSIRKPRVSERTAHTLTPRVTVSSANMARKRRFRGKDGGAKRGERGNV